MGTIMVTGVAGFIGSHLASGFINSGRKVVGVDNLQGGNKENLPPTPNPLFPFYEADLADYFAVREIFMAEKPEIVYHCAANAREGASEYCPYKIAKNNLLIAMAVIENGIKYGMKRLIHLSSMSVYGDQEPPFNERMKPRPVDPYGANKACIEQIIKMLSETHKFEWTILRPHNLIGERQNMSDALRNVATIFCNRILRREPLYIYGENHQRAFSNIKDCLPAMINASQKNEAIGEIINIGGREAITVAELAEEIIGNFSEYDRPEIIQLPPRPHEVVDAWCTTEKSIKLLDYKETYGWRQGVMDVVSWAKKQGPQLWKADHLPLLRKDAPLPWREIQKEHLG